VAIVTTLVLAAVPASALAVEHDVPGTPLGPSGASGAIDVSTSPRDVYAVYLFAGQEVAFTKTSHDSTGIWGVYLNLFKPGILTIVGSNSLASCGGFGASLIDYTPAVSGIYYLDAATPDNGVTYTIGVHGAESMPLATATALSGPSRVKVKKVLTVSGTVSPGDSAGRVTITKTHLVGGAWKRAGSPGVSVTAGTFTYSFTPKYRGKWRLVASYLGNTVGDTTYVSSKSRVKAVTVK
jgi:hypothetical protein